MSKCKSRKNRHKRHHKLMVEVYYREQMLEDAGLFLPEIAGGGMSFTPFDAAAESAEEYLDE